MYAVLLTGISEGRLDRESPVLATLCSLFRTPRGRAHLVVPPDALCAEAGHAALGHDERGARLRPAGHLQVHRAVHGRHLHARRCESVCRVWPAPRQTLHVHIVTEQSCCSYERTPRALRWR